MAGSESGSLQIEMVGVSSSSTGPKASYTTPKVVNSSQAVPSKFTRKNTRGVTRMGSLRSNDLFAPDDLEAQRHRSQWLFKVRTTLSVKNEEKYKSKWDFCILKLPEIDRQPPEEYTPVAWRFGLHNRESLDTDGSEALKISYANAFGLVGDELDKFCNAVVDDPKSMLRCYGLQEEATSWSDDVIKYVLALDALFLALEMDWDVPGEYLWTSEQKNLINEDNLFKSRSISWIESCLMEFDLCKYENQIPFALIQRASRYLRKSKLEFLDEEQRPGDNDEVEFCQRWDKKWKASAVRIGISPLLDLNVDFEEMEGEFPMTNSQHILGIAYEVICGNGGMQRTCDESQDDYIRIPSATQLKASGIIIKGLPHKPLCKTSYESNCLSLPMMKMYDSTVPFIRNMSRYEEHLDESRSMFSDYLWIMYDLIKTPMDIDILVRCGVIDNGNGVNAFNRWVVVEQHLAEKSSSIEHNKIKIAINERCKLRRYKLWSEFRNLFCSKPWLVLSAITIVLVTVATLIQAYVAIIGSNRMKPNFP